jgi:SpoVK/Ycf46/Vps4 family AAA+-type ATPase
LEYIEAQARSVFEVLQQLSQVVILFDECDELFRDRKPLPGTDQVRNITAFVTASMLPKLQDLHDRGRVVFAICTNHLESMDPAIKRGGRIDHLIGIGPPDKSARRKIIEHAISARLKKPYSREAIDKLASETERFTRVEIERAAKSIRNEFKSGADARAQAKEIANKMRASLTISVQELDEFNRTKREFSHPHQERGLK